MEFGRAPGGPTAPRCRRAGSGWCRASRRRVRAATSVSKCTTCISACTPASVRPAHSVEMRCCGELRTGPPRACPEPCGPRAGSASRRRPGRCSGCRGPASRNQEHRGRRRALSAVRRATACACDLRSPALSASTSSTSERAPSTSPMACSSRASDSLTAWGLSSSSWADAEGRRAIGRRRCRAGGQAGQGAHVEFDEARVGRQAGTAAQRGRTGVVGVVGRAGQGVGGSAPGAVSKSFSRSTVGCAAMAGGQRRRRRVAAGAGA